MSLIAIVILAGCAHPGRIRGPELVDLKLGMSKQEVVGILGKPQSASANEKSEIYRYWIDSGHWTQINHDLIFVDGKLKLFGLSDNPDFKARLELIVKER